MNNLMLEIAEDENTAHSLVSDMVINYLLSENQKIGFFTGNSSNYFRLVPIIKSKLSLSSRGKEFRNSFRSFFNALGEEKLKFYTPMNMDFLTFKDKYDVVIIDFSFCSETSVFDIDIFSSYVLDIIKNKTTEKGVVLFLGNENIIEFFSKFLKDNKFRYWGSPYFYGEKYDYNTQ